jgi:hypothetical protein
MTRANSAVLAMTMLFAAANLARADPDQPIRQQIEKIRPEVALVHFTWTLAGSTAPDGKAMGERKGVFVFVLTREAGSWIIRAAQNADIVESGAVPQVACKSKSRSGPRGPVPPNGSELP